MNLKLDRPHRKETEKKTVPMALVWVLAVAVVIALTFIIGSFHRPEEEVASGMGESAKWRDMAIQKNLEEMRGK